MEPEKMETRNGTVWICEAYFAPSFKDVASIDRLEVVDRSRFMCYIDKIEQNTSVELRFVNRSLPLRPEEKALVLLIPSNHKILSSSIKEGVILILSAPYRSKWQVILNADFRESKQMSLQFPG